MVNVQQYINHKYPKQQRADIRKLEISNQNLEGELSLEEFINLEKLDCSNNLLTKLNLNSCQAEKLTELNISDNNFSSQDLSFLTTFVNLQTICLQNSDKEKIQQGIYNRFRGSLEPLQNLNKLERLNISGTNIDSGLEYLPRSLCNFNYQDNEVPRAKVTKIQSDLEPYQQFYTESIWIWQLTNSNLLPYSTKKEELKKKIEEVKEKIGEKKWNQGGHRNYKIEKQEDLLNKLKESLFYVHLNERLPQVNEGIKVKQIAEQNQLLKEKIANLEKEIKEIKQQSTLAHELISLVVPNNSLDLSVLKEEIRKVKSESLTYQIQTKKTELEALKNTVKIKLNEELIDLLEILLESQAENIYNNTSFAKKQLERTKKSLNKKLTNEEIQNLLEKQKSITQLEIQLENLQAQRQEFQTQIQIPLNN